MGELGCGQSDLCFRWRRPRSRSQRRSTCSPPPPVPRTESVSPHAARPTRCCRRSCGPRGACRAPASPCPPARGTCLRCERVGCMRSVGRTPAIARANSRWEAQSRLPMPQHRRFKAMGDPSGHQPLRDTPSTRRRTRSDADPLVLHRLLPIKGDQDVGHRGPAVEQADGEGLDQSVLLQRGDLGRAGRAWSSACLGTARGPCEASPHHRASLSAPGTAGFGTPC